MQEVIGTMGDEETKRSSLIGNGVIYDEVPLINDSEIDFAGIENKVDSSTTMVLIQRSKGYSTRKSLTIETIEKILAGDGKVESMPQVVSTECELPHAPKIFKETCQINWNQPAKRIYDFVRGLSPVPAAWTMLHEESGETGVMMKVYQTAKTGKPVGTALPGTIQKAQNCLLVATADEWIELKSIQLAGKKRMEVRDFLNGFHNIEIYSFAAV